MKKTGIKEWLSILRSTTKRWWDKDPFRQSAVIAYYAIFSIPVMLVIAIDLGGIAFGQTEVRNEISAAITDSFGHDTAVEIQNMLIKSIQHKSTIVAEIIGVITLIFGATGVFLELQISLNSIWDAHPPVKQGFGYFIKNRLLSFGLIVSIGFLLAISLIITSLLTIFSGWISQQFSIIAVYLLHVINFSFSLFAISFLFACMFKVLPDTKVNWKHMWPGAILTALLFVLGKYALGYYFVRFQPASIYGTAGSIVLLLLWVSYSCIIVLFGAEFTRHYSYYKDSGEFLA